MCSCSYPFIQSCVRFLILYFVSSNCGCAIIIFFSSFFPFYFVQWCTALNGKLCLKYVNFDLCCFDWSDIGLIKKFKKNLSWLDFHYHHTLDFNYIHLLQTMDIIPSEITYCRFSPLFWCNIRNKRTSLDNRWHEQHDCVYICKTVDAWSQNSHTFKTKNINKNLFQHDRSS